MKLAYLLLASQIVGCNPVPALADKAIDFDRLATAIRRAEGNSNYGILTHYKHTSYRQACINTCKHAYQDWLKLSPTGFKTQNKGYLAFLANRYAPIGVANDPLGLNRNWLRNVTVIYNEDKN